MTSLVERGEIITLAQDAMDSATRQDRACMVIRARHLQVCVLRGSGCECSCSGTTRSTGTASSTS